MAGDYSRIRFDALRDHSGVLLQQGRVLLDADWNELVAIVERRLRAAAADLGSTGPTPGVAGVAVVPRTTPDGFRVEATAGALTIGRGRMYVDGLLAENHGTGALAYEPLLAEMRGSADTPYDQQPYWPTPDPLPSTGTHLVYLDVWQREVTPLEAPDLVEQAVGVDTTTRWQTAWQVRVHAPDTPGVTCATDDADVPGWAAVIAPSAGRLTTGTVPVDDDDDPCALPPAGGYRGLENQTYRVEVHDGGSVGTATFKWSRDNGSVAFPVVEVMDAATVRPASLGRDDVLGFHTGDWVEVLDDHRELAGTPGAMRQVTVHEAAGTLTFAPDLPADLQLSVADARDRHLRVRRWDQKGRVLTTTGTLVVDLTPASASGVVPVPAAGAAVVLEHGITVALTAPGGTFRTGDHWVFAARTNDASVEPLTAAPPRGPVHHYARLAVVAPPSTESDCRTLWPPLGGGDGCSDCTVCVTPESHASGALTVQAAVDQVAAGGGTVCLAAGLYQLGEDAVRIHDARSVTLRGQGARTVLVSRATAVHVSSSAFVTVQDLAVLCGGLAPAVRVQGSAAVTLQRLVAVVGGQDDPGQPAFSLERLTAQTRLRDNVVLAPVGVAGGDAKNGGLLAAELEVSENLLVCRSAGVDLSGVVAHLFDTTVRGNTVVRAEQAGLRLLGLAVAGARVSVVGNACWVDGTGVVVSSGDVSVLDTAVTGLPGSLERRSDGIVVTRGLGGVARGRVRLAGNDVTGVGGAAVAVRVPVGDLAVEGTTVQGSAQGIVLDRGARAASVRVVGNVVRDVAARESDGTQDCAGIQVVGAQRAEVVDNVVAGLATGREPPGVVAGVRVVSCPESRVAGNSVDEVGTDERPGVGIGVHVTGLLHRTQVSGNSARRSGRSVDEVPFSRWTGLVVGPSVAEEDAGEEVAPVAGFLTLAGVGLVLSSVGAFVLARPTEIAAIVDGNTVTGGGDAPAALVSVGGDLVVSANQLQQRREAPRAALQARARSATVTGNRARGGPPSIVLDVDPNAAAVVGNVTTFGVEVAGAPLAAPWSALNPDGVL